MTTTRAGAVTVTLALTLGLLAAGVLAPGWARRLGLDVWNLPAEYEESTADAERCGDLIDQIVRVARESEASGHVASRLSAGSITLAEAVDELEPFLRHRVGFEAAFAQDSDPPPTFRHRVARHLIAHAEGGYPPVSKRWATVSARLWTEYAALK